MKTSFYFVLWIAIYLVIGLFGGRMVQEYAFVIALVLVFVISNLLNKALQPQIANLLMVESLRYCEMLYTNDYHQQRKQARKMLLFDLGTAIYMSVSTVVILAFTVKGMGSMWIALAVFAWLTYWYIKRTIADSKVYNMLRRTQGVVFPSDPQFEQTYYQFCSERQYRSYAEMLPRTTAKDNLLKIANIVFSVLCVMIGLWFIGTTVIGALFGGMDFSQIVDIAYGGLALAFGLNDFITSV